MSTEVEVYFVLHRTIKFLLILDQRLDISVELIRLDRVFEEKHLSMQSLFQQLNVFVSQLKFLLMTYPPKRDPDGEIFAVHEIDFIQVPEVNNLVVRDHIVGHFLSEIPHFEGVEDVGFHPAGQHFIVGHVPEDVWVVQHRMV